MSYKGIPQHFDQRNTRALGNLTPGRQCGYVTTAGIRAYYTGEKLDADLIYEVMDSIEPQFGNPGFGERYLMRFPGMANKRLGEHTQTYADYLTDFFANNGMNLKCEIVTASRKAIEDTIDAGHAALLPSKLTPTGHFAWSAKHIKDVGLSVEDSWGDWNTGYKSHSGKDVLISWPDAEKYIIGAFKIFGKVSNV